jgi:hypothetical protein
VGVVVVVDERAAEVEQDGADPRRLRHRCPLASLAPLTLTDPRPRDDGQRRRALPPCDER